MRCRSVMSCVAVIVAMTIGSAAHADLVGSIVDISAPLGGATDVEVGAGVEYTAEFPPLSLVETIDIYGGGFIYTIDAQDPDTDIVFTGYVINISGLTFSQDPGLAIGNVELAGGVGAEFVDTIEWTDDSVTVTFLDQSPAFNGLLVFDFVITPVPAPGALAGLLLAGCIGGRRRRRA